MQESLPSADVERRVEEYTRQSNLSWVTVALVAHRKEILSRWLEAAAEQPFHHGRRDSAVADHIPELFDALVHFLQRAEPRSIDPGAPLNDPDIQAGAQGHALARAQQGLEPGDVLVEFRLLRQELWHALRMVIPDGAPTGDVVSAEMLLNDALDGAAALALTALTTRLEQLREEFLATTLHEVLQPMTRMTGFVQLAQRVLSRPEPNLADVREALAQVRRATDEMDDLLRTLVDASRTALGGIQLDVSTVDFAGVVRTAVAHLEPEAAHRVSLHIAPDVSTVGEWDAHRLAQVVSNLLSNALKYSPPESPICLRLESDGEAIVLSVNDRGIGIPPDDLARLFQRYSRAQNAVAEGIEGLGLGLYLCREIVEAHGGRIWADSQGAHRGTTFFVELPFSHTPVDGES
ncbi:MAG: hypothetical protein NVSMB22_17590 [Chloroflexota bacterium]